jgi:hypothetical protein
MLSLIYLATRPSHPVAACHVYQQSVPQHDRKSPRLARTFVVLSERQRLREAFGVIFSQVLMHGSDIRAALHAW